MKPSLQLVVQILLYPFYIILIQLPNLFDDWFFDRYKSSIKQIRKNCVFLINPGSGKRLGARVLEVLGQLNLRHLAFDILQDDYIGHLSQAARGLAGGERLFVVICGGDGTVSTIISEIEARVPGFERVVFVPMPIGTGNDLSQALNFGRSFSVRSFFEYFRKLNSEQTSIVKFDAWDVQFRPSRPGVPAWQRKMLLYLNFGFDARVTEMFDRARTRWPFMFQMNVG